MGQDFSSGSPLLPTLQAAWDLSVNNETFSCFNQMQFCKRFLWFSKSIKNDICSALTLIRSSTEHKHWKLLVGEEDIKIPQPLWARLKNSVTLCSASLELCHLTCLSFLWALTWGSSRQLQRQNISIYHGVPLICFTERCLKAWTKWPASLRSELPSLVVVTSSGLERSFLLETESETSTGGQHSHYKGSPSPAQV